MFTSNRLSHLLSGLPGLRVGVIGDLFLDRYLEIDPAAHELSIETGLEALQVARVRNSPGALGTVMNNLAALGVGRLWPLTVLGDDGEAYDLRKELRRLPIDESGVLCDADRQTPTYTKPLRRASDGSWRELNRLDLRPRAPLSGETEARILTRLPELFDATDGLIVLDQVSEEGWGVVTPRVRAAICELAVQCPDKLVFIDSRAHVGRFHGGVLKPNCEECRRATGLQDIAAAVQSLVARTRQPVFCTLGADGILLAQPDQMPRRMAAVPVVGPIDTVGAGDSTTAGIVAARLSGGSWEEAAAFGNLVASITIRQLGMTGTATPDQICEAATANP